jgi:hypothetical protein
VGHLSVVDVSGVPWQGEGAIAVGVVDKQRDIGLHQCALTHKRHNPIYVVLLLLSGNYGREQENEGADPLGHAERHHMVAVLTGDVDDLIVHSNVSNARNGCCNGKGFHVAIEVPVMVFFVDGEVIGHHKHTHGLHQVKQIVQQVLGIKTVLIEH